MKNEAVIAQYNHLSEDTLAFHHRNLSPFVISDAEVPLVNCHQLSFQFLKQEYPDRTIKAEKTLQENEAKTFSLEEYCDYALSTNEAEPYYVHLKLDGSYQKLRESIRVSPLLYNWFDALPEKIRPHFFWILIGPAHSGTKMHVDMMKTSAWNLLIEGEKSWTFELAGKQVQYQQQPGDLVYVPSMCPHSVVNPIPSLAITENVLNVHNIAWVTDYFRSQGMEDWAKILQLIKEKHDQSRS